MDRISKPIPNPPSCMLVNHRGSGVSSDPHALVVTFNTWLLTGDQTGATVILENAPSNWSSKETPWPHLPATLQALLTSVSNMIEIKDRLFEDTKLGVLTIHLNKGETRIGVLNALLEQAGDPTRWQERYMGQPEPQDVSRRLNDELAQRFVKAIFG